MKGNVPDIQILSKSILGLHLDPPSVNGKSIGSSATIEEVLASLIELRTKLFILFFVSICSYCFIDASVPVAFYPYCFIDAPVHIASQTHLFIMFYR